MNKDMTTVLNNPAVSKQMQAQGFSPQPTNPEQLKKYLTEQLAIWKSAIKTAGIPQQ
jgi:tripartite-type tricarboxylate transporter receptor subunit TctC